MAGREKLKAARYRLGLSQEALAAQVGVSVNAVGLWERGEKHPYPIHTYKLCELFGVTPEELGLTEVPHASENEGGLDINNSRRTLLQALGFMSAELLIPSSSQSDLLLKNSHLLVSAESVQSINEITRQFRAIQRRGEIFYLDGLKSHITTIQTTLSHTADDQMRSNLWRALALAQLVMCFHPTMRAKQRSQVKTSHELSASYAQQSGDTALIGATIGHLAHHYLRSEANPAKASELLYEAQNYTRGNTALEGWLAALSAQIMARSGNRKQCESSLDKAISLAHHVPYPEDSYFTDFGLLSANTFALNSHLKLGDTKDIKKAQSYLEKISLDDLLDMRRASAFFDAARIFAASGDLDQAQSYALRAIDKARGTSQLYVVNRCKTLAKTLQTIDAHNPHALAIAEYANSVQ